MPDFAKVIDAIRVLCKDDAKTLNMLLDMLLRAHATNANTAVMEKLPSLQFVGCASCLKSALNAKRIVVPDLTVYSADDLPGALAEAVKRLYDHIGELLGESRARWSGVSFEVGGLAEAGYRLRVSTIIVPLADSKTS